MVASLAAAEAAEAVAGGKPTRPSAQLYLSPSFATTNKRPLSHSGRFLMQEQKSKCATNIAHQPYSN